MKKKILKKIARYTSLAILITLCTVLGPDLHEMYLVNVKGDAVVKLIVPGKGMGTGFNIKKDGKYYILTNKHVCDLSRNGKMVALGDSSLTIHNIIKKSKKHDLCLLSGLPRNNHISLAYSTYLQESIYVIGHPRGEYRTLEKGRIVGAPRITIATKLGHKGCKYKKVLIGGLLPVCVRTLKTIQTNAVGFPGNSGSPVVNKWGNLIGVLFAGERGVEAKSYLVPLSYVKDFIK